MNGLKVCNKNAQGSPLFLKLLLDELATSDALQTKVSLITSKKTRLFVVSAGHHVKPCSKLQCDFLLVHSTNRTNVFVSE